MSRYAIVLAIMMALPGPSVLAENAASVREVASGRVKADAVTKYFGSPTGYEAYKPGPNANATVRDTTGVKVVIEHNPRNARGYSITSAYPINR